MQNFAVFTTIYMSMINDLYKAWRDYLLADMPVMFTRKQPNKREGDIRIRASSLGHCAIKEAHEKLGTAYSHPALAVHQDAQLQMFAEGTLVGHMWAEAIAQRWPDAECEVELSGDLRGIPLVGRADNVVTGIPIEIKHTLYRTPTPSHMLQVMAYAYLLGKDHGYVVLQQPRGTPQIFRVEVDIDALHRELIEQDFQLGEVDERGEAAYNFNINTQIRIGECIDNKVAEPRIAGRLQEVDGRAYAKGELIPGNFTVKCPFFGHCFGLKGSRYTTLYGENGQLEVSSQPLIA